MGGFGITWSLRLSWNSFYVGRDKPWQFGVQFWCFLFGKGTFFVTSCANKIMTLVIFLVLSENLWCGALYIIVFGESHFWSLYPSDMADRHVKDHLFNVANYEEPHWNSGLVKLEGILSEYRAGFQSLRVKKRIERIVFNRNIDECSGYLIYE